MRIVVAAILSIILPGTGHLLYRRYLRGAVLAVLFSASFNAGLIFRLFATGAQKPATVALFLAISGCIWAYSLINLLLIHKSRRAKDFQSQKDELLKAAQVAWLRDEFSDAERLLREILRRDDRDTEAWVHLGKIYNSLGRKREARLCFESALHLDGSSAWEYMLREELTYDDSAETGSAATS